MSSMAEDAGRSDRRSERVDRAMVRKRSTQLLCGLVVVAVVAAKKIGGGGGLILMLGVKYIKGE